MRTKIIAGNLVAVLIVGLVSWAVVSSSVKTTLVREVDAQIGNDGRLFERSFRLSAYEFVEHVSARAAERQTVAIFSAPSEADQRTRAFEQANRIAAWFGGRSRGRGGPPDIVVITDDRGVGIARNQDRNRMHGTDLTRELPSLAGVLSRGSTLHDAWRLGTGQAKLLQTAIAPIRNPDGLVVGALIVGYDLSNGMATREGGLLGRDIAFLTQDSVYSSSLPGGEVAGLQRGLFERYGGQTRSMLTGPGGNVTPPWLVRIESQDYVGVTGALPQTPSAPVGYAVFANRTSQAEKAGSSNIILVLMSLGLLLVVIYGFLVGTSMLRPIEQMEEDVLAVINGRTDLRLDIKSAELGGLSYRINQLLNVFTGTPEADDEGRVSQPPSWRDSVAGQPLEDLEESEGEGEPAPSAEDAEVAEGLAAEPPDAYYARIYREYVDAKAAAGQDVSNIPQDRFVQRLQANEKSLVRKHSCRMVRFVVQTQGTQVNLQPVIIR